MTICQLLLELYRSAIVSNRMDQADIIIECFLMAKRMHKKLIEYKYPGSNQERETEENWREEVTGIFKNLKC